MRLAIYAAATALLFSGVTVYADTTYDITTTNVIYGGDISGTITGSGVMVDSFDITVSDGVNNFVFDSAAGSTDSVSNTGVTLSNLDPIYQITIMDSSHDDLYLYITGDFDSGLMAVSNTTPLYLGGAPFPGASDIGYSLEPSLEVVDSEGAGGNDSYAVVVPSAATPEPSSLILLGTGVLGLAGAARRRFLNA